MKATTIVASAARTASGNGDAVATNANQINLLVNVTAVAGTTPTLDLKLQYSHDGGTSWADAEAADTFTQITAAKVVAKRFDVKGPHYRVVWTIGGTTPSFTFTISEASK